MWLCCKYRMFIVLVFPLLYLQCEGTNTSFNEQIRKYDLEEGVNLTDVQTLQKHSVGLGHYTNLTPPKNPVKFKDVPDSVLSGSSHSRGLLHHDHTGYGYTDYDEPHYGHGFDHQGPDHHYEFHGDGHHYIPNHHIPNHHVGYGHHYKHYDHGLAAKALIWPIAGIALLGAAAALVSNPVLLQLGVVSGKRRRRQTDELQNSEEFVRNSLNKLPQKSIKTDNMEHESPKIGTTILRKSDLKAVDFEMPKLLTRKPKYQVEKVQHKFTADADDKFVPIPLKFKIP